MHRIEGEAHVDLSGAEAGVDFLGVVGHKLHLNFRVPSLDWFHDGRQQIAVDAVHAGNDNSAELRRGQRLVNRAIQLKPLLGKGNYFFVFVLTIISFIIIFWTFFFLGITCG